MEEHDDPNPSTSDTSMLKKQENAITPFGPPSSRMQPASAFLPSGRVEANSGLLRIGQNSTDVSGFEQNPMEDDRSGITPVDDDDGGEATSARIAQEYRRQVRIKRLAEEIQQTERQRKKEDEQRRKTETSIKGSAAGSKKNETARVDMDQSLGIAENSEDALAKKREAAMIAYKSASSGSKSKSGLATALIVLLLFGGMGAGAWYFLNRMAAQKEKESNDEIAATALVNKKNEDKTLKMVQDLQAREDELNRQKHAAEEAAKVAEMQKIALNDQLHLQEVERQKALNAAATQRIADVRKIQEDNQRLIEQSNFEKEELRKTIAKAQIIAHEKQKKDQDAENARINVTAPPPPALPDKIESDKIELPSGGVRLLVKASDPYGGKLFFQWRQVKGTEVDIVDSTASKFVDGKWVSQTYFVANQPGAYEFEVSVKNDEGVESKKKFPIEVLPPTTLK